MTEFPRHTNDTAPDGAEEALQQAEDKFGFVPNLIGHLAEAPNAARAYVTLDRLFGESTLTPVEQQVVLLSVAFENRCRYCVAAHTAGARMAEAPEDVIEALRSGRELPDSKLDALSSFTRAVVRDRGWVGEEELSRFLDAGFTRRNVLEVLLGVTQKTLSNYTNHLVDTELDPALGQFAWSPPEKAGAPAD